MSLHKYIVTLARYEYALVDAIDEDAAMARAAAVARNGRPEAEIHAVEAKRIEHMAAQEKNSGSATPSPT